LGDRYGVHRPAESEVKDEATEQWLDKNFDTAAMSGYEWVHEEEYRYSVFMYCATAVKLINSFT
jgi:hypothetical protein